MVRKSLILFLLPLNKYGVRDRFVTFWFPIRYKWANKVNNFVEQS